MKVVVAGMGYLNGPFLAHGALRHLFKCLEKLYRHFESDELEVEPTFDILTVWELKAENQREITNNGAPAGFLHVSGNLDFKKGLCRGRSPKPACPGSAELYMPGKASCLLLGGWEGWRPKAVQRYS